MSIQGIQNNRYESVFHPPAGFEAGDARQSVTHRLSPDSQLARLADEAGLSALAPRVQAALQEIAQPDGSVAESLEQSVVRLQDGFVDSLYGILSENEVSLSEKLTLRLDDEANLIAGDGHPEKERLDKILSGTPGLSAVFKEIASQSELLRDVRNIGKVMNGRSGLEQYSYMSQSSSRSVYQISLKGDMSHFYFSQGKN